jgi:hypothetical protein
MPEWLPGGVLSNIREIQVVGHEQLPFFSDGRGDDRILCSPQILLERRHHVVLRGTQQVRESLREVLVQLDPHPVVSV